MPQLLFTVHDVKAGTYLPPFFVPARGLATRAFTDCINSKEHQFGKHPHDYTLFYLGEFDEETAEFALVPPQSMGNGVEFIETQPSPSEIKRNGAHQPAISDNQTG